MGLTKYQMKALLDFEEFGYLVVEAPIQSGKSILLKEIIKRNIGKETIGVVCPSLAMYKECYEREFNEKITYIPRVMFSNENIHTHQFTLIIGDEVFIEPRESIKTACVLTQSYFIHHWNLKEVPFIDNSKIDFLRKSLTKEMFRTLTGIAS